MREEGVFTRDATAMVDETGKVYAWNPYAFYDPRDDSKVYALQLDYKVEGEKIYVPSHGNFVNPADGFVYTIDPEATVHEGKVFTDSGPDPVPSFPDLGYEFVNPIV
jgi:hypothetical protein